MATKVYPSFPLAGFDASIQFDVQISVTRNGRVLTYGLPGARWVATLTFPNDIDDIKRGAIEAFLVSLKGGANRMQMGHMGRKQPNGTLRATPALSGAHVAGAEQLSLKNATGTLRAGDLIGVPNQLLMVESDATASGGNMTVVIKPALFAGYSDGTAVTWNAPTTLWIPQNSTAGPFPYRPGRSRPGFSVDFVEAPA